ncbi:MAG: hypothetical protein Q8N62_02880 [Candidatus Omnitrophota bacterium]|nr:hypothetical protein [Candidatus Omnitrophota bacterium]
MSRFAKNTLLKYGNSNYQFLLPRTLSAERRAIRGKADIFVVIFLGLASFGWGMVIYQNILQRESEERIAKAVREEIEYRRQTEDSIKQDIEAQKKAQAFILQLDYEKELAGFIRQEIADSENRQIQHYKKLEDLFAGEAQAYRQKQQEYEQQLVGYRTGVEEYSVLLQKNIERLDEYKNKVLGNDKKLTQLEKKMDLQIKRIADYDRRLAEILKILEESKEKQKELPVQQI